MLIKSTHCVLFALIFLALGSSFRLNAQADDASIRNEKYPFLRQDINVIDNNLEGLKHFYRQLDLLINRKKRTVNIVHIGDSHIQADWFSGKVRKELQEEFGSAGRGLVFPYRVAKTNSPPDINSSSNVQWSSKRNIHRSGNMPIGISGITIQTRSSDFVLKLDVQGNENKFNKITLFTEKGPLSYNLNVSSNPDQSKEDLNPSISLQGNELSHEQAIYHEVIAGESLASIAETYRVSIASVKELNHIEGSTIYAGQKLLIKRTKILNHTPISSSQYQDYSSVATGFHSSSQFVSTVYLPEAVNTVFLRGDKNMDSQNEATIYGIVLENYEHSGILYHMVGVNGAQFIHYNNSSELFLEQLQVLRPDLIIISLGANETANKWFNGDHFFKQLDTFIHSLEQNTPHASILLTTPADALLSRQYPNENITKARDIIIDYAIRNGLAAWNFYDVMGGLESIRNWYNTGLAQRDHLTKAGYELQGTLLFEAIRNGYGSYRAER